MDAASRTTVTPPMDDRSRIRAIVAASSGNLVEWFDFYIYAFMSLYFAHAFSHQVVQPSSCSTRRVCLPPVL
jgi:MHS family alpha-ketoglutarate permease-like MFS transporter